MWSLLLRVRVCGVWLALCLLFDVRLFVRVQVWLVFVGMGRGLWCMVSFMFLVRRSSLCERSGMIGLCWQGLGFMVYG